jgi:hypothetical protein
MGLAVGLLSRREPDLDQKIPLLHHGVLACMIVVAAWVFFYRMDRFRLDIYHGFAPWWAMKITEGTRIPLFWEGEGVIGYAVGGCINAYRSPLFMGSSLGLAELTGSFLICGRLAAALASLLTPVFLYLLVRKVAGKDAALMVAAISLIWPTSLICGRCDTNMSWVTPWFILAAWLLLSSGETASVLTTVAAGGVVGFCLYPGYLYSPSRLIPAAAGGFFLLGLLRSKKRLSRRLMILFLLMLCVVGMVALNPLDLKELLKQWTYGGPVQVKVPDSIPSYLKPYLTVVFHVVRTGVEENVRGIADLLFTVKQGPLYHILITPLLLPGFFMLWGRRWFKHGIFLWPWFLVAVLPGLAKGPVYSSRVALLEALPMVTAGIVLSEIVRRTFGRAALAVHSAAALVVAGLLGLWVSGWYFQDPKAREEDRMASQMIAAARDGFQFVEEGLVLIEPIDHDEIERLSLLFTDMTGERTSDPSSQLCFLWPCLDRSRPQTVALGATGEDRSWIYLPRDWKGGASEAALSETSLYGYGVTFQGLPLDVFHINERRHHPNVAFVKEPIFLYADLAELLAHLKTKNQKLFFYVPVEPVRERALRDAGIPMDVMPGGYYMRGQWDPEKGPVAASSSSGPERTPDPTPLPIGQGTW